eukprot:g67306.t1
MQQILQLIFDMHKTCNYCFCRQLLPSAPACPSLWNIFGCVQEPFIHQYERNILVQQVTANIHEAILECRVQFYLHSKPRCSKMMQRFCSSPPLSGGMLSHFDLQAHWKPITAKSLPRHWTNSIPPQAVWQACNLGWAAGGLHWCWTRDWLEAE